MSGRRLASCAELRRWPDLPCIGAQYAPCYDELHASPARSAISSHVSRQVPNRLHALVDALAGAAELRRNLSLRQAVAANELGDAAFTHSQSVQQGGEGAALFVAGHISTLVRREPREPFARATPAAHQIDTTMSRQRLQPGNGGRGVPHAGPTFHQL